MCYIVLHHRTTNNGTGGGGDGGSSGNEGNNDRHVVNVVKRRFCTLGLRDQCLANEQCVARPKSTVLRSHSGLCKCKLGFVNDPQTGLCVHGRNKQLVS